MSDSPIGRLPSNAVQPTLQQQLLLRACLFEAEAGLQAWRQWQAQVDFEGPMDGGSYRLLPLLYGNLRRLGVNEPVMGRLKGIYRRTWYKNQMLFHTAADVLRLLHQSGIETMVLKGAALTKLYYGDNGLRSMNDFDVLIPTAKRREAIDLLTQSGWRPLYSSIERLSDAVLDLRHAYGFRNAEGREFDLHWHVLADCLSAGADDDFWHNAMPLRLEDVQTRTLDATDHLLHVCAHGEAWNPTPPIRWVADALTILQRTPTPIDWARFVRQAKRCRVCLAACHALQVLGDQFGADIPSNVLAQLETHPMSALEREYYRALTRQATLWRPIKVQWHRFRLLACGPGMLSAHQFSEFVRYLELYYVKTRSELVHRALRRIVREFV